MIYGSMLKRFILLNFTSMRGVKMITVPPFKFQWDTLPKTVFHKDPRRITHYTPGFGYGDLDKGGNISLHSASRLGEVNRLMLLLSLDMMKEGMWMAASSEYTFSEHFYDVASHNQSIQGEIKFGQLGKYSYSQHDSFYLTSNKEFLFDVKATFLHVDEKTRRLKYLPDWFREKFSLEPELVHAERIQKLLRPSSTMCEPCTVVWSDCDIYMHSNQASYLRYCLNAAETLSRKEPRVFTVIKGNLSHYRVLSMTRLFLRETKPGDHLYTHVWEDEENPWKLNFDIVKDGVSCYHSSIQFQEFINNGKSKL